MISTIMPEATPAELTTIAVRDLKPGDKFIHKFLATGTEIQRENILEVTATQIDGSGWFRISYNGGDAELTSPVTWRGGSQFYAVKEWA